MNFKDYKPEKNVVNFKQHKKGNNCDKNLGLDPDYYKNIFKMIIQSVFNNLRLRTKTIILLSVLFTFFSIFYTIISLIIFLTNLIF
jgi:hypothetical protein